MNLQETIRRVLREETSEDKEITLKKLITKMGPSDIRDGNKIEIEDDSLFNMTNKLTINIDYLSQETLDKINNLMDSMGWFPTGIKSPIENEGRYSHNIKNVLDKKNVVIGYEAKLGGEINPNKDKAYHVTPDIFLNKIKETGLTPKTESKLSDHPERIYLFLNQDKDIPKQMVRALWNSLSNDKKQNIKNYYVLEIDLTQIPNHKFYEDPQASLTYMAVFTLQPIPKSAIKVVGKIDTSNITPYIVLTPEERKKQEEYRLKRERENEIMKQKDAEMKPIYDKIQQQLDQLGHDTTISMDDLLGLKESIRKILKEETSAKQRARDMVKKIGFLKASKMVGGLEELHKMIDLKGTQDDMKFVVGSILKNDIPDKICNFVISKRFGSLDILVNIPEPDGLSEWRIKSMEIELENKIRSFVHALGNALYRGYDLNVSAVRC